MENINAATHNMKVSLTRMGLKPFVSVPGFKKCLKAAETYFGNKLGVETKSMGVFCASTMFAQKAGFENPKYVGAMVTRIIAPLFKGKEVTDVIEAAKVAFETIEARANATPFVGYVSGIKVPEKEKAVMHAASIAALYIRAREQAYA